MTSTPRIPLYIEIIYYMILLYNNVMYPMVKTGFRLPRILHKTPSAVYQRRSVLGNINILLYIILVSVRRGNFVRELVSRSRRTPLVFPSPSPTLKPHQLQRSFQQSFLRRGEGQRGYSPSPSPSPLGVGRNRCCSIL